MKRVALMLAFIALVLPASALAQSISMYSVRRIARQQAAREMVVYDATSYRVTCGQTGRITALCRLRMISATADDGSNYDCSLYVRYRLGRDGYIRTALVGDYC